MRRTILLLATMALTLLVASGAALAVTKIGTNGPDTLRGTNKADNLVGRGGNDILYGLRGRDNLVGGEGKDWVVGGSPQDQSAEGDKNLVGGSGNDALLAGGGNDEIIDGDFREFSHDNISGGPGKDAFFVWHKPAFKDIVVCGDGFDRVLADPKDVVAPDCARVQILQGPIEELLQQEQEFVPSPAIVDLEAGLAPPPH